jgi:hypothetical protein
MLQTWLISYHEIQKRDPSAAEPILLLAHFDNRDIWYELVKCGSHSSNRPTWFVRVISDSLVFNECLRTLIKFSLIEVKQLDAAEPACLEPQALAGNRSKQRAAYRK